MNHGDSRWTAVAHGRTDMFTQPQVGRTTLDWLPEFSYPVCTA